MPNLKHDWPRELWYNRPWVYIPAVVRFMKDHPYISIKGRRDFRIWLRNCFYLNWQVAYKHDHRVTYSGCLMCLCHTCQDRKCAKKLCTICDKMSKRYGHRGHPTFVCGRNDHAIDEEANIYT